jgi:hypothetical protein
MPTFKVQSQVYHLIGPLLPKAGEQAQFLQVYYMGDSDEEARISGTIASDTRMEIIRPLQTMLHNLHKYISIFKTTLQRLQSEASLTTTKSASVQKRPQQESIGVHTMPQKLAR